MQGFRGKVKNKLSRFLDLLYPPRCVGCRELLEYDTSDMFCEKCRAQWEEYKNEKCRRCGQPIRECWCGVPDNIGEAVFREVHLVQYDKSEGLIKDVIYSAKRLGNKRNFKALANEMYTELYPRLPDGEYIVTAVPRSKAAIRKYGHDQSTTMAKEFCILSGFEYIETIYHVGTKRQKSLTQKQRLENATKSYRIGSGLKKTLKGKNVILIDDVVTTGASVVRCANLLKSKGADKVFVMCIAKTI